MSTRQSAPGTSKTGNGKGGDILPLLIIVLLLVVLVPHVLKTMGVWTPPKSSKAAGGGADAPLAVLAGLGNVIASLWSQWWWLLAVAAGVLIAARVWLWWARRRRVSRVEQARQLMAELHEVMPNGWDAQRCLRIRGWRGIHPARVRLELPRTSNLDDPEWRVQLSKTLKAHMGSELQPLNWPKTADKKRIVTAALPHRRSTQWALGLLKNPLTRSKWYLKPAEDLTDGGYTNDLEELLVKALARVGVPSPAPQVTEQSTVGPIIRVGYAETSRDQSPAWRGRVVDQVSARLGQPFRAVWNRQNREFTLEPVPQLPHPIGWQESFREFVVKGIGKWVAPYGTDENGRVVAWEPGDREPHALFTGDPGTGKTETIKAVICSLLLRGALVVILDPKQKDFAEFLGRPGVVCVATSVEDRVGALIDLEAEMTRRTSASALGRLEHQYPDLVEGERPPQAAIDNVPIIIVADELTKHTSDVQTWWAGLSSEEKKGYGAEKARNAPMLAIPGRITQLARAILMHMAIGMQRPDASGFGGDSTSMRDQITHLASLGQLSPIGSQMMYGNPHTGSNVEIQNPGEGLSNGLRYDDSGKLVGRGQPGRFKAWYVGTAAESELFWAEVAKVAPDTSLIQLPHVSLAARSPEAAARELRLRAYTTSEGTNDAGSAEADTDVEAGGHTVAAPSQAGDDPADLLRPAAELVVTLNLASAGLLHRKLRISFETAQSVLDLLEEAGVIGPQVGDGQPREVLVAAAHLEQHLEGHTKISPATEEEAPVEQQQDVETLTADGELLARSARLVVEAGTGSVSMLQRELRLGYDRCKELMAALEVAGVVGPSRKKKPREVLMSVAELEAVNRPKGDIPLTPVSELLPAGPEAAIPAVSPDAEPADEPSDEQMKYVWTAVTATQLSAGDKVSFGDLAEAEVMEDPAWVEDGFDGAEVIRLLIDFEGEEQVVDLDGEELVNRRALP